MKFYINKITGEIHKEDCIFVGCPNVIELGEEDTSFGAKLSAIIKGYSKADGCEKCSPEIHTK